MFVFLTAGQKICKKVLLLIFSHLLKAEGSIGELRKQLADELITEIFISYRKYLLPEYKRPLEHIN